MNANLDVRSTPIMGLHVVYASPKEDRRGVFARLFCELELKEILGERHIVQCNFSCTRCIGAVRGLHFQNTPHAEMKFIRCIHGRVWDVCVDLRRHSPTFLKWHSEVLDSKEMKMMVIPEGCAHGFQVLEENSEMLYFHTAEYNKKSEGGVRYDDPKIGVTWPLAITELSDGDREHSLLLNDFTGVE